MQLGLRPMLLLITPVIVPVSSSGVKGLREAPVPTPKTLAAKRGCSPSAAFPQDTAEPLSRRPSCCWRPASPGAAREARQGGHGSARTARERGCWERPRLVPHRERGQVSGTEWSPSPEALPPQSRTASVHLPRRGGGGPSGSPPPAAAVPSGSAGRCSRRLSGLLGPDPCQARTA